MNHASPDAQRLKCRLAAEVVRGAGRVQLRVTGTSMLPSVWPGDVLEIERTPDNVTIGDLLLFIREDRLWVHRLVSVEGGYLLTRGDALPCPDLPLPRTELLGRVLAIRRGITRRAPRRSLSAFEMWLRSMIHRFDLFQFAIVRLHALNTRLFSYKTRREALPE